jgi:aspartate oxidase
MLGEGAHLLNSKLERFLLELRPQGEAGSPKTLLNREIWKQVEKGRGLSHGGVYVDLRHIDPNIVKAYPWFYKRLKDNGVDPCASLIEVGPMAHSLSGGIRVDAAYQSDLPGFFAVGEASGGIHGACRCAGNAASQAVLSGMICAERAAELHRSLRPGRPLGRSSYKYDKDTADSFIPRIRAAAEKALGPFRDGPVLEDSLKILEEMAEDRRVKNDSLTVQVLCALTLMLRSALARKETRGSHIRIDYPESRTEYEGFSIIQ